MPSSPVPLERALVHLIEDAERARRIAPRDLEDWAEGPAERYRPWGAEL